MTFTDKTFEQRRAQLLKGASASEPVSTGSFSSGNTGVVDQTFEQRRKQILTQQAQPVAQQKISATPTPAPATPTFTQQAGNIGQSILSGIGNFAQQVEKKVQGIFTPKNGTSFEITLPQKKIVTTPTFTPDQQKKIGSLKVGEKIPEFDTSMPEQISSGKIKDGVDTSAENIIDHLFNKPTDYILNNTGIFGKEIKTIASKLC